MTNVPAPKGSPVTNEQLPVVSIVVPMLNEIDFIDECLDGFAAQTYPKTLLDIMVVDGGSTDGSRTRVETRMMAEPWIRIVENPKRKASAAFNAGVQAARGEIVGLFSAHGVPAPEFVEKSVDLLWNEGASGVGGRYLHVGHDPVSNAVGCAMVSPFGMASPHRFASERGIVDTISHPMYRASALAEVGPFDETLERNSDYELNWRLRELGHSLWFDPAVESVYRPRGSVKALARQFWWYGRWKRRVIARHPDSMRARHLVPPLFVTFLAASPLLLAWPRTRKLTLAALGAYAVVVAAGTVHARPWEHDADPKVVALCFPAMHVAWGAGFLTSVVEDAVRRG